MGNLRGNPAGYGSSSTLRTECAELFVAETGFYRMGRRKRMKTARLLLSAFLGAVLALAIAPQNAGAQDEPPQGPPQQDQGPPQDQGPQQDPPGRIARMNYSEGSVSFQPGGE